MCHTFWTEIQDLDLNQYEEYRERLDRGELVRVRDEFQIEREVYPPADPDEVIKRYKKSSRATRIHGSLKQYVEGVKEYYRENGGDEVVEKLDELSLPSKQSERKRHEIVKERVQKVSMEAK